MTYSWWLRDDNTDSYGGSTIQNGNNREFLISDERFYKEMEKKKFK